MGIYPQHYSSYEGPLEPGGAWWTFAKIQFKLMFQWTRTKVILVIMLLPSFIMLLAAFGESGIGEQVSGTDFQKKKAQVLAAYLQYQAFAVGFVYVVSACTAVSEDLRHKTLQLYFTRPVSRTEYLGGKWLGLFMLGSIVSVGPHVMVEAVRMTYSLSSEHAGEMLRQMVLSSGLSIFMTAVFAALVVGISSFTRRTAYALLGWIGLLAIPTIANLVLEPIFSESTWPALVSLSGNVFLATTFLLLEPEGQIPFVVPYIILFGSGFGILWAARRRLSRIEELA